MSYQTRYEEKERDHHKEFCGDCPVYERATEANNHWNFTECTYSCYKLPLNRVTNKKLLKQEDLLTERLTPTQFKRLYYDEKLLLKDIALQFKVSVDTLYRYMRIHKLQRSKVTFNFSKWRRENKDKTVKNKKWLGTSFSQKGVYENIIHGLINGV